ncbi:MAG: hypothetical protein CMF91_00350 [Candidatus Marinimicrobia bacterium]|nr:hypothetical protein [Candidatus Neomarinimicrobiota bacterium]|tara:strand:- start:190 stop:501 length:312 start_codon:yes stop_codon:yes gene_type:complete
MNKIVNGVVIPLTEQEIAEFNAKKPTDAEIIAQKWVAVRVERNAKLAATDWRANSDLTLSDEWKTYRQALRDIPTQTDAISINPASGSIVDNITWPAVPNSGN